MKIEHIKYIKSGQFQALDQEANVGELSYFYAKEHVMIINHTHVNPSYRGKGIGDLLVLEAIDFARVNNLKIIAQCSFVANYFAKNSQFEDVLEQ